ncbi:Shab [Acrasis kona]|uniref:Shab n=1 Tax=Acrasis kona TaxID=1008807 RepID=A0AAW2Z5V3_9EUKA
MKEDGVDNNFTPADALQISLDELNQTTEDFVNKPRTQSNTSSPRSLTQPISMHRRFRNKLKEIIDQPSSSIVAKVYFLVIALLVSASVVIMILDSHASLDENASAIMIADGVTNGLLLLDLLLRFYASVHSVKRLVKFITSITNITDFLATLPFFIVVLFDRILGMYPSIGILRVFRLLRLLRLLNFSTRMRALWLALKMSITVIASIMFITMLCVLISSTIEYYLERGTWDSTERVWRRHDGTISPFSSIPQSMWWSILTLLAVGYGDIVPITPIGKFAGAMTMIVGILLISMPSLILSKTYTELLANQMRTEDETREDLRMDLMKFMEKRTLMIENIQLLMERQEMMMRDVESNRAQMAELSKLIQRNTGMH